MELTLPPDRGGAAGEDDTQSYRHEADEMPEDIGDRVHDARVVCAPPTGVESGELEVPAYREHVPPPPQPAVCPLCAPSALARNRALGEAVREAVAAAFAELQPSLVQAVAAAVAPVAQRRKTPRDHAGVSSRLTSSDSGSADLVGAARALGMDDARLSDEVRPRRSFRTTTGNSFTSACGLHFGHFRSDASIISPASVSRVSSLASPSVVSPSTVEVPTQQPGAAISINSLPSLGPPTVRCLEASLAQALLENTGLFGLTAHYGGGTRRTSSSSQRGTERGTEDSGEAPPNVRIVPAPQEERPRARAAAAEPAAGEEAPGRKNLRIVLPGALSADGSGPLDDDGGGSSPEEDGVAMDSVPSTTSRWTRAGMRTMTSNQVLHARIQELANEAGQSESIAQHSNDHVSTTSMRNEMCMPAALQIIGVLPWDAHRSPWKSWVYQWAARLAVALAVLVFFLPSLLPVSVQHGVLPSCEASTTMCWQREGSLSQVPISAGALVVLMPVGFVRHQKLLEETFVLLRGVALERAYGGLSARHAVWDRVVFFIIWACIVLTTALCDYYSTDLAADQVFVTLTLHVSLIAIFSAVILCKAYGMVYVCRSLCIMIDVFCCDIVQTTQLQDVAHVWNLTQAVLRKASISVETSLLALCIILVSTVPLLVLDIGILGAQSAALPTMLPGMLVTCGILYVFFMAATISEKCTRVPALVNAVTFGPEMDRARQHTVEYITSSAAGFYVFGMRLTIATIAKFMYVWCIVAIGFLARLASTEKDQPGLFS